MEATPGFMMPANFHHQSKRTGLARIIRPAELSYWEACPQPSMSESNRTVSSGAWVLSTLSRFTQLELTRERKTEVALKGDP